MYSSNLGSGEEAADHAHEILAQLSCHGHLAMLAAPFFRGAPRYFSPFFSSLFFFRAFFFCWLAGLVLCLAGCLI
jgi:hypothetical protein